MDIAGKRVTKQPERLTYVNILQLEIRTQTNMVPFTTTSTATLSTNAVSMSSGQSVSNTDTTERDQRQIHAMFTQLKAEARSSKAERTKDKQELMSCFNQYLERWQGVDTQFVKLEDNQMQIESRNVQHDKAIESNPNHVLSFEDDVVFIRNDISRLALQVNRIPIVNDNRPQLSNQMSSSSPLLLPDVSVGFQPSRCQ